MSRQSKKELIEEHNRALAVWASDKFFYESKIQRLEDELEKAEQKIRDLYAANDELIHTPEFAADTEAAFERGRQDGIRSVVSRANNDTVALGNALAVELNTLVNKFTRGLTYDMMFTRLEEESTVEELPDTDFTKNMLAKIDKINMKAGPHTEHSVVQ